MHKIPAGVISFLTWGGAVAWIVNCIIYSFYKAEFSQLYSIGEYFSEWMVMIFIYPIFASLTPIGLISFSAMVIGFIARGSHPAFKNH